MSPTYAATPGRSGCGMRDGGCAARVASGASASRISYPASRLSHHAYAASAVTNPLTAAAASRCPYSIIVGRSSGGSSVRLGEHTSGLHPLTFLVYRLFLLKKKKQEQQLVRPYLPNDGRVVRVSSAVPQVR